MEREHLGNLRVDGRIILKRVLENKLIGCQTYITGSKYNIFLGIL
jgi:hypothetical protein